VTGRFRGRVRGRSFLLIKYIQFSKEHTNSFEWGRTNLPPCKICTNCREIGLGSTSMKLKKVLPSTSIHHKHTPHGCRRLIKAFWSEALRLCNKKYPYLTSYEVKYLASTRPPSIFNLRRKCKLASRQLSFFRELNRTGVGRSVSFLNCESFTLSS